MDPEVITDSACLEYVRGCTYTRLVRADISIPLFHAKTEENYECCRNHKMTRTQKKITGRGKLEKRIVK